MRVDFYQLTRDPAELLLPILAEKTLASGNRLAVVAREQVLRDNISDQLWTRKAESFLAHDMAGGANDAHQPILLYETLPAPPQNLANGAGFMVIADSQWRAELLAQDYGLARIFYLFAPDHIDEARTSWKSLKDHEGLTRHYWRQEGKNWVEAG